MRKYLWIAVLFAACNNESSNSPATKDSGMVAEKKSSPASSGPCNKLVFFEEGAEIESKTYKAVGDPVSTQLTKILSVKKEGGMTIASVESTDTQGNGKVTKMSYDYKCDGNNIYFDMASLFRANAEKSGTSFKASVIEYPINVSAGQTLPDATGTMTSERNGKTMEMKYHYKDRKVEAKEDVTTTAGTFSCYKISNSVEIDMEIPGMDERAKKIMESMKDKMKTTSTTWFAPDFGIVKMEMYQGGKLISKTEVTAVKK